MCCLQSRTRWALRFFARELLHTIQVSRCSALVTSHTAYNFLCAANPFISSKGSEGPTHWDRNFWLELSFFDVALAAETCGEYFTALLFVEIYCEVESCLLVFSVCTSFTFSSVTRFETVPFAVSSRINLQ